MNQIYDANYLYRASLRAKQGSSWKPEVQSYMYHWLFNVTALQHELEDRTYQDSIGSTFILKERGHERLIVGKRMRDRVVRHSLCDNVLTPAIEPYLIYANCASQIGKGIHLQRQILVKHLRNYYHHHGNEGYILLMDFSKFYDNIRHDRSLEMLDDIVADEYALWLTAKIFEGFQVDVSYMTEEEFARCIDVKFNSVAYWDSIDPSLRTGEKMMPKSNDIGDQTSQVTSVFYPHRIDNYVKIVCGKRYYGRYMDDSYMIAETKEELLEVYAGIRSIAEELGIFINEKKTRIVKLSDGFRFLQVKYILTDTGKVIQRINPKRITAMRRKLRKLADKVHAGEREYEDIENMFKSWMGSHHKLMDKSQIQGMNDLFNKLFGSRLEYRHGKYTSYHPSGRRDRDPGHPQRKQLYNRSGYQR